MIRVLENTGIMGNDALDRLRQEAILAHHDAPLPDAIVHYIQALESEYAIRKHEERKQAMSKIGWKLTESAE